MIQGDYRRVLFVLGAFALLWGLAAAQQPDQPIAVPTSADVAAASVQPEKILSLAPADAWFIAYTSDLEQSFKNPILKQAADSRGGVAAVLHTLTDTFHGPGMLAVSGTVDNPPSWRVTFAARTVLDRDVFFQRFAAEIVPAWNRSPVGATAGELQFVEDRARSYLTVSGPVPFSLTLVTRNGIVFGSNAPGKVDKWERGIETDGRFVNSDDFKRLNAGRSAPVGTFLYLNTRSLIPLAADALNQTLPKLYEALQLDVVESVALIGSGSSNPRRLRLAIGAKEIKKGPWRLLASAPSEITLARAFPPDTTLLVEGAMARGADIVEDIKAFAAVIDREITDEYEQERAEFNSETGLDPQSDILANFAGAWAFGVSCDSNGFDDPLLALQLESVETFKTHLQTLRMLYQLKTSSINHRGVTIERVARKASPFSYGVVENVLLVSPENEAVTEAIDAILDRKGLDRTRAFDAIRRRLASPTSKFVYVNLAELFSCPPESKDDADASYAEAVAGAGTAIGLAVVTHERMIALEFVSSDDTTDAAIAVLWQSLDASLERARYLSARMVSTANVQGLLTACHVYTADHEKQWPPSLEALVESGLLGDRSQAAKLLTNPYDGEPESAVATYYLYRFIPDAATVNNPAAEVVISEPEIRSGGAVFGFCDGHAEWIESPRANELLVIMRSGH